MTTNQLAYQNNKEVERHNKVMEDKTAESNQIAAEKNRLTAEYNDRMATLEERRLEWAKQYQTATLEQKTYIDQVLADIQDDKNRISSEYNAIQRGWYQTQNAINAFKAAEEQRHNQFMENSAYFQNILRYNEISGNQLLKWQELNQQFSLRSRELANYEQQTLNQNSYWQGLVQIGERNATSTEVQAQANKDLVASQAFRNYAGGVGDIARGAGAVLDSIDFFKFIPKLWNKQGKNKGSSPLTWEDLFGGN